MFKRFSVERRINSSVICTLHIWALFIFYSVKIYYDSIGIVPDAWLHLQLVVTLQLIAIWTKLLLLNGNHSITNNPNVKTLLDSTVLNASTTHMKKNIEAIHKANTEWADQNKLSVSRNCVYFRLIVVNTIYVCLSLCVNCILCANLWRESNRQPSINTRMRTHTKKY